MSQVGLGLKLESCIADLVENNFQSVVGVSLVGFEFI